ncbi:hypothetical protein BaRGS_00001324 [Batillaria attramentaria]|uniref:Uncharacterized protein n=1 Tax=Batillaria attramentaria TaxID=370345 RepID=A0ABD0M6I3_9CAEN
MVSKAIVRRTTSNWTKHRSALQSTKPTTVGFHDPQSTKSWCPSRDRLPILARATTDVPVDVRAISRRNCIISVQHCHACLLPGLPHGRTVLDRFKHANLEFEPQGLSPASKKPQILTVNQPFYKLQPYMKFCSVAARLKG